MPERRYKLLGNTLMFLVDECNCPGEGPDGVPAHYPLCGWEPIGDIEDIVRDAQAYAGLPKPTRDLDGVRDA